MSGDRKIKGKEIHILTLTPFYPSRKDERGGFVAEPLTEFAALGLESSVMAVRALHKGRVLASTSAPAATWVHYPVWPGNRGLAYSGQALFLRIRGIVRRLHRERPIDILHAHAPLPCGEAARLLSEDLGIPFVVTVHGLDAYFTEQIGGRAGERCGKLCRKVYEQAARVICISEHVRQRVLERMPDIKRTEVVENGVDAGMFFPAEEGPSGQCIASVGSLIAIKGHDVTLRALAELKNEFADLRCRIVGEGAELGRLQGLAQELGIAERVEFLGRRRRIEVAELLRESMVFVLPSRYEGLGCVYLEAMASGIPAIACVGQGIEEVIRDGENGFLITEQDWRGLASLLRTLIQEPELRDAIGVAGRKTIVGEGLSGFTLLHQAKGLQSIYRDCRA